jgi:RimK family alpha-L-glutamate ligase
MRIAILSGGAGWHVRDLARAAKGLGHDAAVIDFRRLTAAIPGPKKVSGSFSAELCSGESPLQDSAEKDPDTFFGPSGTLSDHDAAIVRTMPPGSLEQVVFRMDLLHRFQAGGGRVLNPPLALETCIDKYLASVRLEAAGLPVPRTIVCQDAEAAATAFRKLGGDVVIKPLFGSEGRGMVRITDEEIAWRTFRTLERLQAVLYVQRFVPNPGWDLRAFVIGNRVIAAMRRHARGDWRTNVAQGGRTEAVTLTVDEERLTLAAARAVGTPVAGVDLLPRPDGGYDVLEVNAVPGWRALGPATGVDVATEIIRFLADGF